MEENKIFYIEEIKINPVVKRKSKTKAKKDKKLQPIKNSKKTIRNQDSYMGIVKNQGIRFLRFKNFDKSTRKVFNSSNLDVFAIENESQA